MKNKAFTLIELLVVIAVIGLLASIIIVNLTGARSKANIARGLQFSQSIHHNLGAYAVGVWSFDEGSGTTANDASGYNNHGTLTNGPVWRCASTDSNYTPSGQGCSIQFDGANDYVYVGTNSSLTPNNITIQAWVKANSISTWNGIISNMTSWGTGFSLQIGTAQNIAAMVSGSYLMTSWLPRVNTWYHIAATHDSSTNTNILYVNGKEENRMTRSVTYEANPKTYIGVFYTSPGLLFNGLIDEVRIYEKALETAEVEALYYAGLDNLLAKGLIDEQEYQERLALR